MAGKGGPGRKRGKPNKVTAEKVQRALEGGPLPAESLLSLGRAAFSMCTKFQPREIETADGKKAIGDERKFMEWMKIAGQMFALAAPYYNYRLSAVKIEDRRVDLTRLNDAELAQFEELYARAALTRSDQGGAGSTHH